MIAQLTGYKRGTFGITHFSEWEATDEKEAMRQGKAIVETPQNSGWCQKSPRSNQFLLWTPTHRYTLGIYTAPPPF